MNTRDINIRLITTDLPDDIHGVCSLRQDGSYLVFLNSRDPAETQEESFIHEMLHIWHKDHDCGMTADQVEQRRHEKGAAVNSVQTNTEPQ